MLDLGECLILSNCGSALPCRSNATRLGGGRRRQRPKPQRDRSIWRRPWYGVNRVVCADCLPWVLVQLTIWNSSVANSRCVIIALPLAESQIPHVMVFIRALRWKTRREHTLVRCSTTKATTSIKSAPKVTKCITAAVETPQCLIVPDPRDVRMRAQKEENVESDLLSRLDQEIADGELARVASCSSSPICLQRHTRRPSSPIRSRRIQ